MEEKEQKKQNKAIANANEIINSQIALTMTRDNDTETKEFLKKLGLDENADEDIALNSVMFSTIHYIQAIALRMQKDIELTIGNLKLGVYYYKEKCKENHVDDKLKELKDDAN